MIRVWDFTENSNGLHLYQSNGHSGLYIALSHRWSKSDEQFRTEKSNFKTRCKEINFYELPKTFQDAVTVTRKVGVEYLWIDSLCIIQDDDDDRRRECSRMEEVFASAYCTLAATSAKDCSQGLFREDNEVSLGPENRYSLCIRDVDEDFSRDVEQAELNQRGWVFQERALSLRIIHFTATQTYWECGKMASCESADPIHV